MKESKFKQTEVGMIPSDWDVLSTGQIANVLTGFPFPGNTILENGKTRLLRGINITEGLIRHSEDIDRYYSGNEESLKDYALRENDLVIGMDGSKVGKNSAIIDKNHSGDLLVQRVARLRMRNPQQPVSYVFYFVASDFFIAYIDSIKTSSAIPHISPLDIRNFRIPFPPTIEEQQRIANALSDVDTLISNLEKLIAKKKNIKQGAMQQLLTGRKRLPGFGPSCHPERSTKCAVEGSSHFKMTELGPIPSDWEFIPVSELAKDMADGPFGSNLKKEHYTSDPETRIIQLSNIGEEGWIDENIKYTTFEHAKTIARCIVPNEESILVAKMMPAGRAIICPNVERQYVLGSDVIRITANEKLYSKYFVYASKSNVYLKQISDNTQGSTRQRTSISKLRKIQILLPSSVKEQTAVANVLTDMDTEIQTLEIKLAKYRKLKTGMMQQLLTGKIRLI